jgi:translation initiation factor IF-2
MTEDKMMRLSQVARKLNVGTQTIAEHLANKGFEVENNPNSKITIAQYEMLEKEFKSSALDKEEASGLTIGKKHNESFVINAGVDAHKSKDDEDEIFIKNVSTPKEPSIKSAPKEDENERFVSGGHKLQGIKVVGKIDLDKKPAKPAPEVEIEAKKEEPKIEPPKPVVEQPKNIEEVEQPKAEVKEQPKAEIKEQPKAERKEVKEEKPVEKLEEATPKVEKKAEVPTPKPTSEQAKVSTPEAASVKDRKDETKPPAVEIPKAENKQPESDQVKEKEYDVIEAKADTLKGLTVLGKIELPTDKSKKKAKPVASSDDQRNKNKKKRPRKRLGQPEGRPQGQAQGSVQAQGAGKPPHKVGGGGPGKEGEGRPPHPGKGAPGQGKSFQKPHFKGGKPGGAPGQQQQRPPRFEKEEPSDKEIQEQIKATLAKLSGGSGKKGNVARSKYRKEKRSSMAEANEERMLQEQEEAKTLKVTEFISANDLASLMDVSVNQVISTCMSLGLFVSINQRLDAETITVIADEFGYNVSFSSEENDIVVEEEVDTLEQLEHRAPIVTIMGHVDHGKTSLLDYIRRTKVTEGEAGGITQHIGAYDVKTADGKAITFLDTPGHEAFTAMRARGAKVTDVVIIVVAADDNVMPQTKEAINHAQVAGVPIVVAINKVDKPTANPEKIREELAQINILVEDWGGKYQCQEISAKSGQGINELLEKVLLEAELLELKANTKKKASGTVIEATLDKGRGYVATILVQNGTLKIQDVILAGAHYGKVRAMFDHTGKRLTEAGPSKPIQVLGLDGAPQAGDKFHVMDSDKEARDIANKREQIQREQSIRTKKHITLDEIGRRLAIGSFKELNIIVKGDVDGSVEALSDSLLKLSTTEVQVKIIHKAVGQISESDVLLASASDAVIVGFQVRPSSGARKIAEQEEIEIRLYSIIYDAINDVKDAMEGMLAPKIEEVITGNAEVRNVFKISKVGTVAGCYVTEGNIKRSHQVRLVRDGIVVCTGTIDQLKRFKDDVSEVKFGYECGISIKNFNDIREGDNIEAFEQKEVKRKL